MKIVEPLPRYPILPPCNWRFGFDAPVKKKTGGRWHGRVVGFYSTALTPEGYAVESRYERGSVQIYPVSALEPWDV